MSLLETPTRSSPLLRLPVELRLEILRYLLCMDCNRKAHTRRPPQSSISELLYLNPRRILEAAPFKHKGNQEINGSPPYHQELQATHGDPEKHASSSTWKEIPSSTQTIRSSLSRQGSRAWVQNSRTMAFPVLGPFPSSRLMNNASDKAHLARFTFNPLILFTGKATREDAPVYISSHVDAADFMHALWIMVKSPFSRGMTFNVTLSNRAPSSTSQPNRSFRQAGCLAMVTYQYQVDQLSSFSDISA